jgi:hypothetical protein
MAPWFRADAVGARAAHKARKGDEQYLHEFRAVRAGVFDPFALLGEKGSGSLRV